MLSSRLSRVFAHLAALIAVLGATACSDELSRTIGLTRDAPDEFTVTTRAPLSMPPDYSLRPPRPGATRPQELSERLQAQAALSPQTALDTAGQTGTSPGQQAMVNAAGPAIPRDIRNQVDADAQLEAPGRGFTDRLMFWRRPPLPGTLVDPARESQRLRQNAALGQPAEDGTTPIIQQRRPGILGSIF